MKGAVILSDVSARRNMSSLSDDLNSYLKRGNNGSSTSLSSMTSKLSTFKLPTLKSPFSGSSGSTPEDEEPFLGVNTDDGYGGKTESQSWLSKKMSECLPSLSKKQRIIGFMTSLVLGSLLTYSFLQYSIDFRNNLFWFGNFFSANACYKSTEVFTIIFPRKPFYYIQVGYNRLWDFIPTLWGGRGSDSLV